MCKNVYFYFIFSAMMDIAVVAVAVAVTADGFSAEQQIRRYEVKTYIFIDNKSLEVHT